MRTCQMQEQNAKIASSSNGCETSDASRQILSLLEMKLDRVYDSTPFVFVNEGNVEAMMLQQQKLEGKPKGAAV